MHILVCVIIITCIVIIVLDPLKGGDSGSGDDSGDVSEHHSVSCSSKLEDDSIPFSTDIPPTESCAEKKNYCYNYGLARKEDYEEDYPYGFVESDNSTQSFLFPRVSATVVSDNTGHPQTPKTIFFLKILWKTDDLQLNDGAHIPLQPKYLHCLNEVVDFHGTISGTNHRPNAKPVFVSITAATISRPIVFGVKVTTPADIATDIKTDTKYGASIGSGTQGHLEYQKTVKITEITGPIESDWGYIIDPQAILKSPLPTLTDWMLDFMHTSNNTTFRMCVPVPKPSDVINGLISTGYSVSGTPDADDEIALKNPGPFGLIEYFVCILPVLAILKMVLVSWRKNKDNITELNVQPSEDSNENFDKRTSV